MTPEEVRECVDSMAPRTLPDGRINTQHVAMEQTLRQRHGLPSYVPELDGPGRFLPTLPDRPTEEEVRQAQDAVIAAYNALLPSLRGWWAQVWAALEPLLPLLREAHRAQVRLVHAQYRARRRSRW